MNIKTAINYKAKVRLTEHRLPLLYKRFHRSSNTMKTLIVTITLIFPLLSFGQLSLKSKTVAHPDSSVLFIGIDNHLVIEGTTTKDDIRLTTSKASVSRISNNEFTVRVSHTGEIPFEIYNYNKPKRKLLLSKVFRSETLNSPEAHLGNTTDTIRTTKEILADPRLLVVIPQSNYKHYFTIIRFGLTIRKSNGEILLDAENTPGNMLTKMQKDTIEELTAGDTVTFNEMIVTCPECRNFKLKPYRIIVK